jgi:hypothetical protein
VLAEEGRYPERSCRRRVKPCRRPRLAHFADRFVADDRQCPVQGDLLIVEQFGAT